MCLIHPTVTPLKALLPLAKNIIDIFLNLFVMNLNVYDKEPKK